MTSARTELQLLRVLLRVTPVWHVLAGGLLGAWLVWQTHADPFLTQHTATSALRTGLLVVAISAAFALDDPTEHDLGGTPVSRGARRANRVVLVAVTVAAVWGPLLGLAAAAPALTGGPAAVLGADVWAEMNGGSAPAFTPPPDTASLLPWAALTLELGAVLAVLLGVAAYGTRRSADRAGGVLAAPVTLALAVVLSLLPEPVTFLPGWAASPLTTGQPTEAWEAWVAGHARVALIGAAGLGLLIATSRDPARLGLLAAARRQRRGPNAGAVAAGRAIEDPCA